MIDGHNRCQHQFYSNESFRLFYALFGFAWAGRFINRCRKIYEESEKNGLTSHELKEAEKFIVIEVQSKGFIDEIVCIKKAKPLPIERHRVDI